MTLPTTDSGPIFHIAERDRWEAAVAIGHYRESTRGRSLDQEGFIHGSWRHQVERVANAFYRDAGPLLLLRIDPEAAGIELRIESGGGVESFPHLYGPLPVGAVTEATPLPPGPGGLFVPDRSWLSPSLELRRSPIHGVGLFTVAPVDAGQPVASMGGSVLTDEQFAEHILRAERWSAAALDEGLNILQADDDPLSRGNHACDPNLWMADELTLVARRFIPADQEATVDYALMTVDEGWTMECNCPAEDCRGVVSASDWRRPDLQRRYSGHFSPFIERRIDSLR